MLILLKDLIDSFIFVVDFLDNSNIYFNNLIYVIA